MKKLFAIMLAASIMLPGVKLKAQDDVQKVIAEAAVAIMQAPQS